MAITDGTQFGRVGAFRFWCQKVLPAVYDDSLSYYELLCKLYDWLEKLTEVTNTQSDAITELQETLAEFMEGHFDPYIEEKIDEWFQTHQPDLYNDVETLNVNVASLMDDMEFVLDKHMVVVGDSFSTDDFLATQQLWWYLLAQRLGVTPHCYAVDGTAFVKTTPSPKFQSQVELAAADTSFDNANVKYVFIYGGYNDCYNAASITGSSIWLAVRDTLIAAKTNFPNALIVIAGCNSNKNTYNKGVDFWPQTVYASLMANAVDTQYGAVFLDLTQLFVGEQDFIDSGTDHPNILGQKAIAQAMLNGIYGANPYTNMTTIIDITSKITSGSATKVELVKHEGKWGILATGVRAGEDDFFTVEIPYGINNSLPDNIPCMCDGATGQVTFGAVITGTPSVFHAFANQNANCYLSCNIHAKTANIELGASHTYTI